MAYPKSPIELTEEELLKALEEDSEQYYSFTNDVENFISFFELTHGNKLVQNHFLYKMYKAWSKNPVGKVTFSTNMHAYVGTHQLGQKYYLMNKMPLEIKEKSIKFFKTKRNLTKSPTYKNHFDNFLKRYNIKKGRYYVEGFALYYLYDKWTFETKRKNPLGYQTFLNFLKFYFKAKVKSKSVGNGKQVRNVWFGIQKTILKELSLKEMKEIRQGKHDSHVKKNRKRKEKASNETQQVEIPQPTAEIKSEN